MRIFSFGGGVQSTAVLVLAAQGRVKYDAFVFANVGDDSENPGTLAYLAQIARPFAEQHGLTLVEIRRQRRPTSSPTLYQAVLASQRSIEIPARGERGPFRRHCTHSWKVEPIAQWIRRQGATSADPATMALGISLDEIERARTESQIPWQRLEYPLLDRHLTRRHCAQIIEQAGLPIPPRSACWFCPFRTPRGWRQMRREQPDLFRQAVALERLLCDRAATLGFSGAYLSSAVRPLEEVTATNQGELDDLLDTCESGYCMT